MPLLATDSQGGFELRFETGTRKLMLLIGEFKVFNLRGYVSDVSIDGITATNSRKRMGSCCCRLRPTDYGVESEVRPWK